MKYEIRYKPSYSLLEVQLAQDETVVAEAGAMTYFSPNVEAKTRMCSGGILSSLGMTLLGRQSFFVNDYTSRNGPGKIGLVSAPVGDIDRLEVRSDPGIRNSRVLICRLVPAGPAQPGMGGVHEGNLRTRPLHDQDNRFRGPIHQHLRSN